MSHKVLRTYIKMYIHTDKQINTNMYPRTHRQIVKLMKDDILQMITRPSPHRSAKALMPISETKKQTLAILANNGVI